MKKFFLLLMTLTGVIGVQGNPASPFAWQASLSEDEETEYAYLTFETTDGEKISVPASSAKLAVSGTSLTVAMQGADESSATSQSFVITNLSKMYFTVSDETTTGIEAVENSQMAIDDSAEIYDLRGRKVTKSQMKHGVYIVKTGDKTYKMTVK